MILDCFLLFNYQELAGTVPSAANPPLEEVNTSDEKMLGKYCHVFKFLSTITATLTAPLSTVTDVMYVSEYYKLVLISFPYISDRLVSVVFHRN